jgi:hypothetical protein
VHALIPITWIMCALIAFLVIPIDVARKAIMNNKTAKEE